MTNPSDPTAEPPASPRTGAAPPAPPPIAPAPPPIASASTGGGDGDRYAGRSRRRGTDSTALFWGVLLLIVGTWFFLRETLDLDLPSIRWDTVWPILLIAIGAIVIFRGLRDRGA